jgi:tRNA threonylcarbamoyladenosine biosynthesis protein TsaB
MIILGVTASGTECGIAAARGAELLGSDTFPGARVCVEELTPRIVRLLGGLGLGLRDVDKFAVDVGPGGLTGIKIGLATVNTLAQALDRPVVPVSSLLALCCSAPPGWKTLVPAAACTREDFYTALYIREGGGLVCKEPDRVDTMEGIVEMVKDRTDGDVFLIGGAAALALGAAAAAAGPRVKNGGAIVNPRAADVCAIAAGREGVSCFEARPNYICLTQAERNFGKNTKK